MITHVHIKNSVGRAPAAKKVIAGILAEERKKLDRPFLVAVGGPGGTGKTTFCKELAQVLDNRMVLTLDDYKFSRSERQGKNLFGAHPDANRIALIKEHLGLLRKGESIQKPVYDAVSGNCDASEPFMPGDIIIIDGEISTYEIFKDHIDLSIFIDSDWKTQLNTRVTRDIEERGYTKEKAIATFLQSNLREFEEHGAHSKAWADIHLYCREDYRLLLESISNRLYDSYKALFTAEYDTVDFAGLIVAVPTPFKQSTGELDVRSLILLCEYLAEKGMTRILVNGTTGEFFSLTPDERRIVLETTRMYFPGLVLYHTGVTGVQNNRDGVSMAEDMGADACVVLSPWYPARLSEQGLVDYFCAIEEQSSLPFYIYNFPKNTSNPITPEIVKNIPHHGLKDSGCDFSLIAHTPRYFIGGDRKASEARSLGACGFVSGSAPVAPAVYTRFEEALLKKDKDALPELQEKVTQVSGFVSRSNSIATIKRCLACIISGFPSAVRPPLENSTMNDEEIQKLSILF
ncbi:MAG: hypothetical protein GF401_08905 [Chitinivibrionales bacterium]|nr:hypothetical protein [Chitinivibrionales bacterium]